MRLERYTPQKEVEWNKMVAQSKNGTFLFDRHFMDYHQDRFVDCSMMFYSDDRLLAVLPANINNGDVYSHGGLTYGGLVCGMGMTTSKTLEALKLAVNFCRHDLQARRFFYKPVPYIYHRYPSQEDLYALFRLQAQLISRAVSSTVLLSARPRFTTLRHRGENRALREGVLVEEGLTISDWENYWDVLTSVLLQRHGKRPVHSLSEITLLQSRFPKGIRLFVAKRENRVVAGCVVFVFETTVHVQYIAANDEGRSVGALDMLFSRLMAGDVCQGKRYLDFGISTERQGQVLNEGLVFQKEGFGGRGVCYDEYLIGI